MIDIPEEDIVARRHTADGRFVLFTRTDVPPGWALPWYGVQMDTGGDAVGLLVGLEPAAGVWSLQDLLLVAHGRALAERDQHDDAGIGKAASRLSYAARAASGHRTRVRFLPGPLPSAYPWTVAVLGDHALPFCADARAPDDGVTLAQVLVVLDQLLADAVLPAHRQPLFRILHADVRAALAAVDQSCPPTNDLEVPMLLLTAADAARLPALYATEAVALKDKVVQVKFFTPWTNWTWLGVEYDPAARLFWGWVIGQEQEAGLFSLDELEAIRGPGGLRIERDVHFRPCRLGNVPGVVLR